MVVLFNFKLAAIAACTLLCRGAEAKGAGTASPIYPRLHQSLKLYQGADLFACINQVSSPGKPYTVTMQGGGYGGTIHTRCMKRLGNTKPFNMTIPDAGLFCEPMGYIESKVTTSGGDTCSTSDSLYGFEIDADPKHAHPSRANATVRIYGQIWTKNHAEVVEKSFGVGTICLDRKPCGGKVVKWDKGTFGPLYVCFFISSYLS